MQQEPARQLAHAMRVRCCVSWRCHAPSSVEGHPHCAATRIVDGSHASGVRGCAFCSSLRLTLDEIRAACIMRSVRLRPRGIRTAHCVQQSQHSDSRQPAESDRANAERAQTANRGSHIAFIHSCAATPPHHLLCTPTDLVLINHTERPPAGRPESCSRMTSATRPRTQVDLTPQGIRRRLLVSAAV